MSISVKMSVMTVYNPAAMLFVLSKVPPVVFAHILITRASKITPKVSFSHRDPNASQSQVRMPDRKFVME